MVADRTLRLIETLTEARSLIASPNGWTQDAYTKTEKQYVGGILGRITGTYTKIQSYCAVGAVEKVSGGGQSDALDSLVFAIEVLYPQHCELLSPFDEDLTSDEKITLFNDSLARGKEDVLKVFDYAINTAKLDLRLTRQMANEHEVVYSG